MVKDQNLFKQNIFRKCNGDRSTTRNVLDILPGQLILIRRGLTEQEVGLSVSMISQFTAMAQKNYTFIANLPLIMNN